MPNLSQLKRQRMLEFLNKIKAEHTDDESLIAINEIETEITEKKYGLVWEEHEERVDVEMLTKVPIFSEQVEKEITADETLPYNFLLEGDNLHSLKLLEKTHKGKIDVIYIDPPYNTGNKDFIYDDDYVNSDDLYIHSKWLSFMNERLKIARTLLSDNGLCFISIDDHEQANLKLLCDSIFSEYCFVGMISVETSNGIFGLKAKHANKTIVKSKDYVLVYCVSPDKISFTPLYSQSKRNFDTHFTYFKDGDFECSLNEWLSRNEMLNEKARCIGVQNNVSNLDMLMSMFPEVNDYILENADKIYRIRDYTLKIDEAYIDDLNNGKKIIINGNYVFKNNDGVLLYLYPFSQLVNTTDDYIQKKCSSVIVGDLWKGFNEDMGNVGKEGGITFSNGKKPVRLIKNILKTSNKKNAVVLDFFAGSGTTAQAVLEQNIADGGKRKFILCTNNEGNICEERTYPRIKNVISGYGSYYGIPANLKYYKTDFIDKARDDEEYSVSDELLKHIAEMVQLEYAVKLDGTNYILAMSDEEADTITADKEKLNTCKALYISAAVLLTAEQQEELTNREIAVYVIPDYYFESELLEVGER